MCCSLDTFKRPFTEWVEVRAMFCFLHLNENNTKEIHAEAVAMHGADVPDYDTVV